MTRTRFQGLCNVVIFNRSLYLKAAIVLMLAMIVPWPGRALWAVRVGAAGAAYFLFASLAASHYIYDRSDLYRWSWLKRRFSAPASIVNIHSGFDETSEQLRDLYPHSEITSLDFYDPTLITEVSIARARSLYPSPSSIAVDSRQLPLASGSQPFICCLLAAHELRTYDDKVAFLSEIRRCLDSEGHFVMLEHLRDPANFLAFGPGFMHFFSRECWGTALEQAGLSVREEFSVTPFLRGFVCRAASA